MNTLSVDLETYSSNDIKYGVYKYVDAPDFEILLLGYAFNDDPVAVVDLTKKEVPAEVKRALFDKSILKTAFNANFEITCLKKLYPNLPTEQWECTSVLALYWSLPTGLANVAKALGFPEDKQKDARGKALINYFSKPCKPTKTNGMRTRNYPSDDPEKWVDYMEYNRQDVVVEREIRKKLMALHPNVREHDYWLMDQDINSRGVHINMDLVNTCIRMDKEYRDHLTKRAREITGLENPNSVTQLSSWVGRRLGKEIPSLAKAVISDMLKDELPKDVEEVLSIRQKLGKTSVKKYQTMKEALNHDGRIRGMFQFYGAMRSGRWAGRVVQLHNMARNSMEGKELDIARKLVLDEDLEAVELCYENVSDVLSQLIRTAIEAKSGHRFIVDDYSAIEARVIAWLAGEDWRQEVFANNGDIYCASASAMFGVPVVKHGENGHLRQKGKIAELALGYGGSVGALKAMGADKMGLDNDELNDIVYKWRKSSPRIVQFWYDAESAAKEAIKEGHSVVIPQQRIRFSNKHGALVVTLPSGRELVYLRPSIGENRFGSEAITYMGMNQTSRTFGRLETYGGKLVENIVQATARDCLAAAMLRLSKAGYRIIMHIHDEVVMEMPIGSGSREEVTRIMCMNEPWEEGLIKNADGFEGPYYMKD